MPDDLLSWLRSTIEADKAAAEAVSDPAEISMGAEYVDHCGSDEAAEHIRRHDIQDTIARCEAELAILDEYEGWSHGITEALEADGMVVADPPKEWQLRELWVHRIAYGYRNRPGWKDDWDPTPAHVREWLAGAEERRKLHAKPDDMEAMQARLDTLRAQADAFRVCAECGHIFPSEADLLRDYEQKTIEVGLVFALKRASDVRFCPHCSHDF